MLSAEYMRRRSGEIVAGAAERAIGPRMDIILLETGLIISESVKKPYCRIDSEITDAPSSACHP